MDGQTVRLGGLGVASKLRNAAIMAAKVHSKNFITLDLVIKICPFLYIVSNHFLLSGFLLK